MARYNLGEVLTSIALPDPDKKPDLLQFISREYVKTQEGKYLSAREYINSFDEGQEEKGYKRDKRPGPTKPQEIPQKKNLMQ
ncbi:hypothetical protein [Niabella drilacis]|uniref:Uncharacterized protein n=1 Tax=Niabella drilacis (strain DSM 25811 / CCM 8410 / CCUG 62505 / LMG 26954 / E90) TaxID=1285928 RepID=A0A1G6WYR8_NIADE|nr:hypothetical protein [Niabella drilacis]SDD71100.1 hypothetical protein SAMN04487894_11280 [Niabella drilacis]